MIFGLPWFAIIPLVAIVGGLIYSYKEQELKYEAKRMGKTKELNEMRQIVHNLKTRIENLEAIVTAEKSSAENPGNPLSSIEINDELDGQNDDNSSHGNNKIKN